MAEEVKAVFADAQKLASDARYNMLVQATQKKLTELTGQASFIAKQIAALQIEADAVAKQIKELETKGIEGTQ